MKIKYEDIQTKSFVWPNESKEILFYVQEKTQTELRVVFYYTLEGMLRYDQIEKEVFEEEYSVYWKEARLTNELKEAFIVDLLERGIVTR